MLHVSRLPETSPSYLLGRSIGEGFVIVLIVLGIFKCARIARRETTSGKCVLSLMLVLLAWLVSSIQAMLSSNDLDHIGLTVVLIGIALLLVLAAFVMAIIGLVDYGNHPEFVQGRAQAIWAIVLSAIIFLAAVVGAVAGIVKTQTSRSARTSASSPLEEELESYEEFNLAFQMPGSPWTSINASKVNPDALFVIMRTRPQIFFLVIAERSGIDAGIDSEMLAEIAKANLKSGIPDSEILSEEKYTERGFEVVEFHSSGKLGGNRLSYVHYTIMHNGFAYQLVTWSKTKDREAAHKAARSFLDRFDILDQDRKLYGDDVTSLQEHAGETFGYSLVLPESDWVSGPGLIADFPHADFGAQRGADVGVLVTALRSHGAGFDIDAVTAGLMKVHEFSFPDPEIEVLSTRQEDGKIRRRLRHISSEEDNFWSMLCDVHLAEDRAFLVSAWTLKTAGLEEIAEPILDGFAVLADPGEATPPLPDPVYQGEMLNSLGVYQYGNRQYTEAAAAFQAAAAQNPKKSVYATNVLDAFAKLGDTRSALLFIEGVSPEVAAQPELRSWKAWFFMQEEKNDEALAEYESLFAGAYYSEEDLIFYTDILASRERWDEVDSLLARFLSGQRSSALATKRAEYLAARGEHEQAIEALLAVQGDQPLDVDVCFALIESYNALERYSDTLDLCLRMEEEGKGSPTVTYLIGQAQFRLRWYREAKLSFETCLKTWPGDEDVQAYLSHISSLLGEGDNSSIKTPIAPVAMPGEVLEMLPPLDSPPPVDGYGAWYLSKVIGIAFRKEHEYTKTRHLRVKIEDRTGVSQFSTFRVSFNPNFENIYVNHLKVMDNRGEVLSTGDPSDYYVIHEDNGMASNDRSLHMPVPNLAPGHIIDLVVTVEDKAMPEELPFFDWSLSSRLPVALSAVYFNGDEHQIVSHQTRTDEAKSIDSGLLWTSANPPIYEWAPEAAPIESWLPMVYICQAGATWNALGTDYLQRIDEQLVFDQKIRGLAESVVNGLQTETEKISALANYVQKEITYKAIEFGRRATVPNPARLVIDNRYGDCKDHSVLLHKLLESAGIESHLVLVNTSSEVRRRFPSLDQFNHMIVCVPGDGGYRFIDTTDKGYDLRGIPIALGGKTGLLLQTDHCPLVEIPAYPSDSSELTVKRTVSMLPGRKIRVSEEVSMSGIFASFHRDNLRRYAEVDRKDWCQDTIDSEIGSAALISFAAKNIFVTDEPLEISLEWEADDQYSHVDNRVLLRTPAIWEAISLGVRPSPDRKPPFEILFPLVVRSEVQINALEGHEFDQELAPITRDEPYADWAIEQKRSDHAVELEFTCLLKSGEFPAGEYEAYRTLMDEALRTVRPELQLRRR